MPSFETRELQKRAKATEHALERESSMAREALETSWIEYNKRLVLLTRRRAAAVALGDFILALLMLIPLLGPYRSTVPTVELNLFFLLIISSGTWCLLVATGIRDMREATTHLFSTRERPVARRRMAGIESPEALRIGWLVFLAFAAGVATTFYAMGRLINATGGLTASPFSQVAFTMFVLGQWMATTKKTMLALLVLGLGFFMILVYTTWFGMPNPNVTRHIESLSTWFIYVTGIDLLVSLAVTMVVTFKP
jgi:hypothetical protein